MTKFSHPIVGRGAGYDAVGLSWAIAPWTGGAGRIYANGYPNATTPAAMAKKAVERRAYVWHDKQANTVKVSGQNQDDIKVLEQWFDGYLAALGRLPKGRKDIGPAEWKDLVRHCNGVGNDLAVDGMASGTIRRRTFSQIIGCSGAKYPPSAEQCARLKEIPVPQAWQGSVWFSIRPDAVAPFLRGSDAHAAAMEASAPKAEPVVTIETGPAEPAATPAADTGTFDPDAMTHRDLVELARKGHEAEAAISTAYAATEAAVAELLDAKKATSEAEAERDAAVKRAAMVGPVETKVVTGDGTVEVEGVTLPTFEGGHGPSRIEGYDLSAWRASLDVNGWTATASAPEVARSIMAGDSVRLVGPPSVGKTSGIREVCALTGAKFFLVPCGEGATDLSLIAERIIDDGGAFAWRDGHITAAVRWAINNPGAMTIVVLDEVDHLNPEVQSLLHGVLEGGTLCVNPEENLTVPDTVRFVATANTSGAGDVTGHHASAKVSDTAFTSRWNATYTVAYLPPEAEARLLVNAGADADAAEAAVKVAGMTRTEGASVTQPIVLRQLLAWARACGRGEDPRSAWAWRVITSVPPHDQPAMIELTRTCFGW